MNILEAMADPKLFRPWFKPWESWSAWRVVLAALFGLPMGAEALEVYQEHTGRQEPPSVAADEAWLVVGRRGGKSRVAALVAVFLACFRDYSENLAPGERGVVMVISADRRQARVVFGYIRAFLEAVPMLTALVESSTKESIDLSNRISIEVHTASYRTTRGYTVVAALADEIAFWRSDDSANPDKEILASLQPGMATIPGSLLLAFSSPYARRGVLWDAHKQHHGKEGDPVLVWQAETRAMNPMVSKRIIAQAYAKDPAAAAAEYGAQFRKDVENFVARETIEDVVVPARRQLPPVMDVEYTAFVDPSGGSQDAMTLGICHMEKGVGILDVLMEKKPPFSPAAVVAEFCTTLKIYGITKVTGDRYAGEWPRERFREQGIEYEPSEKPKSDLYRDFLPLLNSGMVELLDNNLLVNQLTGLERRTARSGRDSIDHEPGGHDDLANVAAGALVLVGQPVSHSGLLEWAREQITKTDAEARAVEHAAVASDAVRALSQGARVSVVVPPDAWPVVREAIEKQLEAWRTARCEMNAKLAESELERLGQHFDQESAVAP